MAKGWKKILRKLLRRCAPRISFKLVLYLILTVLLILALFGVSLLLRIALGIYMLHRLFVLASHGWTCPTCLTKMGIAVFLFVAIYLGTADEAIIFFMGLMWFDYFFLKRD